MEWAEEVATKVTNTSKAEVGRIVVYSSYRDDEFAAMQRAERRDLLL